MKTTKLYYKNNDNSIIDKDIELNLVSHYLSMGWVQEEPKTKVEKPEIKVEKNVSKKEFKKEEKING